MEHPIALPTGLATCKSADAIQFGLCLIGRSWMYLYRAALVVGFLAANFPVAAQETCSAGYKKLNAGEPCIPEHLFNYLYCLKVSGGGKVEVTRRTDSSGSKGLEISVGGKGSGVVISGEGNVSMKKSDANRIAQEVSEKIVPSLASNCKSLVQSPKSSAKSSAGGTPEQATRFAKLLGLLGLPSRINLGWGYSLDDFERIVPATDRLVSRTDLIAVKGKTTINSIPATVRYIFDNRKLTAVSIVADAWYSNYEEGNVQNAKTTFTRTEGDETTGKKLCNASFVREVEGRMNALFSKVKDFKVEQKVHSNFVPQSFECSLYGCKSESKSDIWTIGYKDPESKEISVRHSVRRNSYSYEGKNFKVGEETSFGCATEIAFSNRSVGGI